MKITVFFLVCLFLNPITQAASLELRFFCKGPNLHYVNQFNLEGSFIVEGEDFENIGEDGIELLGLELEAKVRDSGFSSLEKDLKMIGLNGLLKKIENRNLSNKPFFALQLRNHADSMKRIHINFIFDYPGFSTSSIRVGSLRTYKSKCEFL